MTSTSRIFLAPLLAIAWAAGVLAEPMAPATEGGGNDPGPACEGGVSHDDGTLETGYGWVPSVIDGRYVQEFHSDEFPTRFLDSVCVCFLRTRRDDAIDFLVELYESVPAPPDEVSESEISETFDYVPAETPFAAFPGSLSDVPMGIVGRFTTVDVNGVQVPEGRFFIGVRWNANVDRFFFVCADQTLASPATNGFFRDEQAEGWASMLKTADPIFDDHRGIFVRGLPTPVPPTEIPALGGLGLGAFLLLLTAAAVRRLRR